MTPAQARLLASVADGRVWIDWYGQGRMDLDGEPHGRSVTERLAVLRRDGLVVPPHGLSGERWRHARLTADGRRALAEATGGAA